MQVPIDLDELTENVWLSNGADVFWKDANLQIIIPLNSVLIYCFDLVFGFNLIFLFLKLSFDTCISGFKTEILKITD